MTVRRLAALLEVFGIYLAGSLVTRLITHVLNLRIDNPLRTFRADITDAELIAASGAYFVILSLQYIGWFGLAVPINWWRARWGARAYGLTTAGWRWPSLIAAGIATAALAAWPAFSVLLADAVFEIGDTVPWRQALFDTSWRRWELWLFTGVMSWGFVAVAEELFFRGYCQSRLAEAWGHGPAIIGIACLFTFAHGQYLSPDAYNVGMVLSLFTLAVGLGVVYAWTGSLVSPIVAHAIINVLMTPFWQGVLLIAFVTIAAITVRRGAAAVRQVFADASLPACLTLAAAGAAYAVAAARFDALVFVAAAMVATAVVLAALARQRPAAAEAMRPTT